MSRFLAMFSTRSENAMKKIFSRTVASFARLSAFLRPCVRSSTFALKYNLLSVYTNMHMSAV
jgi:hypothetical protein